jgi:molybdenum cofactor guanylyltransferase
MGNYGGDSGFTPLYCGENLEYKGGNLMQNKNIALVLAGGASRRMGTDKLALAIEEGGARTVLGQAIHCALQVADEVVLLHSPVATFGVTQMRSLFPQQNLRFFADLMWHEGPLQALAQAWPTYTDTDTSIVTVLPGDLPGVQPEVLRACMEQLEREDERISGVLIQRESRCQPLLGCYRQSTGHVLKRVAAAGEKRILRALEGLQIVEISAEAQNWPSWWTRPIHTPEDYELWWREGRVGNERTN